MGGKVNQLINKEQVDFVEGTSGMSGYNETK